MRTSHWAEELKILNYIYSKKLYIKSVHHTGLGSLNIELYIVKAIHHKSLVHSMLIKTIWASCPS